VISRLTPADFNTLSATLPQPFHLSIPLLKYWDGQPVTYVCQRRHKHGEEVVSPERTFWSIAFEIIDEEAKKDLEKRGGSVSKDAKTEAADHPSDASAKEADTELSDDVD
jgi:hypothetical protein